MIKKIIAVIIIIMIIIIRRIATKFMIEICLLNQVFQN